MPRPRRTNTPRPGHGCKQRGETAELAYCYRAAALGLGVLKPLGDSLPYDVAVDNGRRLLRVQVKSASRPHCGVYEINAGRGRNVKRAYTARDIDFLAACIFAPEKAHRRGRRGRTEAAEAQRPFNEPMTRCPDDPILPARSPDDPILSTRCPDDPILPARSPDDPLVVHPITRSPDRPMCWFIFPLSAFFPRKTIRLSPRHPERWTRFREAWHLLLKEPTTKDTEDHEGQNGSSPSRQHG